MRSVIMRQAGPLQAVEVFSNPDAKWVVLFHGFGADAYDLASVADELNLGEKCNWLFPNGHIAVPIGPNWEGRAWWNIKMSELETTDWANVRPHGMDNAVDKALKMISSMKLEWKNTIIGGFSQGAMLATELYLKAPETPAGLICLSGTLLSRGIWAGEIAKRKGSEIFMSHGEADTMLPHRGSVMLQKFFEDNGVKTRFASFRGGHEIPFQVLEKMKSYISERL